MGHCNYQQLEGTYARVLRSSSFKTKGLILRSGGQELEIILTKKLRPLLALELQPGDRLRLLTEMKKQKTIAINIMKIMNPMIADDDRREPSAPNVPDTPNASCARPGVILEICRKGTCRKRGSLELVDQWQAEAERNPNFAGLECRLTGCLKRCKAGVNVRVGDRVVSRAQTMRLEDIAR
ncbi:MAG: (2Fe-2S) ferredoxin domain-containing protein [Coleofasciculaceae cyanobacterium RL_1_1]|nr:(2Fe-2S) ferredoxin domain-containing protein [Coleofasciculaceae cyanobacterium RL_1_1]